MRLLLLLPLLWASVHSYSQEDQVRPVKLFERYDENRTAALDTPATDTSGTVDQLNAGDVNVIVDPQIERLMELHAEHDHVRQGYRVQIFLGDRRTAEETKRNFLQKYPDIPAYMSWLAPNFRLRVGDLRTRLEAEKMLNELRTDYPGSYIVPDRVEAQRRSTAP